MINLPTVFLSVGRIWCNNKRHNRVFVYWRILATHSLGPVIPQVIAPTLPLPFPLFIPLSFHLPSHTHTLPLFHYSFTYSSYNAQTSHVSLDQFHIQVRIFPRARFVFWKRLMFCCFFHGQVSQEASWQPADPRVPPSSCLTNKTSGISLAIHTQVCWYSEALTCCLGYNAVPVPA